MRNIVVTGSSGAIGAAFITHLAQRHPQARIHALSRSPAKQPSPQVRPMQVDYMDEEALEHAAQTVASHAAPDLVIVAGGILHRNGMMPEKSLRDLSAEKMMALYAANTVAPALIAKHFLPLLPRGRRAVFAALSARVGSISDNQLGGWYSYRASKAALNMIIRNAAIEAARRNPEAVVAGLHPGTVDSGLSQPFQKNVPDGKLFSPQQSVRAMTAVIDGLTAADSGQCFAWDGSLVAP